MVMGKCDACGTGRVPLFAVNHGKVTRLPGMHPKCMLIDKLTIMASRTPAVLIKK